MIYQQAQRAISVRGFNTTFTKATETHASACSTPLNRAAIPSTQACYRTPAMNPGCSTWIDGIGDVRWTGQGHWGCTLWLYRHGEDVAIGAEVPGNTWHTVIALDSGCVLLEVKAGPFDPNQPKNLALWAPDEGMVAASDYLNQLIDFTDISPSNQVADARSHHAPTARCHCPSDS
jgi:hypothetical protein